MKISLDCVSCFLKRAIEAGKIAKTNSAAQKRIVNKVCRKHLG